MSRGNTSGFAAALAAGHVSLFPLVELGFSSGADYLAGVDFEVSYAGNIYLPALGMLAIEPIEETTQTAQGMRILLQGSKSANVALALAERVKGRPVTVRLALVDSAGTLHVDTNVWSGMMDTIALDDSGDAPQVQITAEHMLAVWDRPRPVRYTHAQQTALHPGDLACEYVAALADAQIVWPGKEFFKV